LGLLEPISEELHRGAAESLWQSLAAVDAYRRQFDSTPGTLTNAILLGSLIVPLGLMQGRTRDAEDGRAVPEGRRPGRWVRSSVSCRWRIATSSVCQLLSLRVCDLAANPRQAPCSP
jgi:hypothetical protein